MTSTPVTYLIFDLLYLDGRSLLDTAYSERRELLDGLDLRGDSWQTPPGTAGEGKAVWEASKQHGLEGVVMKRLDSKYSPGARSKAWLKLKNVRTQEVVVAGWKPGEGNRAGTIGSLLLGVPDDKGELQYAGHVGTGFTDTMLRQLKADLTPLAAAEPAFATPVPKPQAKDAHWVTPSIVGEVQFSEWTREGRLRHPSWRGLRPDKGPDEVRRES